MAPCLFKQCRLQFGHPVTKHIAVSISCPVRPCNAKGTPLIIAEHMYEAHHADPPDFEAVRGTCCECLLLTAYATFATHAQECEGPTEHSEQNRRIGSLSAHTAQAEISRNQPVQQVRGINQCDGRTY